MGQSRQQQHADQPIARCTRPQILVIASSQSHGAGRAQGMVRQRHGGLACRQSLLDRIHQQAGQIGAELFIYFAHAGRAGDVDLGDIIPDDI